MFLQNARQRYAFFPKQPNFPRIISPSVRKKALPAPKPIAQHPLSIYYCPGKSTEGAKEHRRGCKPPARNMSEK